MEREKYVEPKCEVVNFSIKATIICVSYESTSESIKSVTFGDGGVEDEGILE